MQVVRDASFVVASIARVLREALVSIQALDQRNGRSPDALHQLTSSVSFRKTLCATYSGATKYSVNLLGLGPV